MQNTHDASREPGTDPVDVSRDDRREYFSPVLKVYGSVRELTLGSATFGSADGGSGMQMGASDTRLKENVLRIGTHPLGFGLYLFDYKPQFRDSWGHGRRFGVMAQEVAQVLPQAVSRLDDGYLAVDYAMLGIRTPVH